MGLVVPSALTHWKKESEKNSLCNIPTQAFSCYPPVIRDIKVAMRNAEAALAFWCGGKPGRPDARETFLEGPNLLSKEPCQLWWQMKPSSDSHSAQQPQPLVVGWEHFPFYKLTMFPEIQVCAQTSIISFFFTQVISAFAWQGRSLANSAGFKRWVSLTWCICVLLGVATVWRAVRMRAVPPSRPGTDEINRE